MVSMSASGSVQTLLDRVGEVLDAAGRHEPAAGLVRDELRNARDVGRDDRAAERQGFHQDDRQPLGETRQDQCPRPPHSGAHLGIGQPTRQFDVILQPKLADSALDFRPQRSIAGDRHLELHALPRQNGESAEENELPFLLTQTPHRHKLDLGNDA